MLDGYVFTGVVTQMSDIMNNDMVQTFLYACLAIGLAGMLIWTLRGSMGGK